MLCTFSGFLLVLLNIPLFWYLLLIMHIKCKYRRAVCTHTWCFSCSFFSSNTHVHLMLHIALTDLTDAYFQLNVWFFNRYFVAVFATGSRDGHIMIWDKRSNKRGKGEKIDCNLPMRYDQILLPISRETESLLTGLAFNGRVLHVDFTLFTLHSHRLYVTPAIDGISNNWKTVCVLLHVGNFSSPGL